MSALAHAELAGWQSTVHAHLGFVLDRARSSALGGDPTWDQVLSHYGVPRDAAGDRRAKATAQHLARGPVLDEVRRVLDAVTSSAIGELERLARAMAAETQADAAVSGRLAELRAWVLALPEGETERYRRETTATPRAGVANIFANAKATTQAASWSMSADSGLLFRCDKCGSEQERALDFRCRYCGGTVR